MAKLRHKEPSVQVEGSGPLFFAGDHPYGSL